MMASSSHLFTCGKAGSKKENVRADGIMEWPDHILESIFVRLPVDARHRFRCLSQRWKEFLSLPSSVPLPSCMILSRDTGKWQNDPNVSFFCQSRKKWFSLPSLNNSNFRMAWEEEHDYEELSDWPCMAWKTVDVNAGLVCDSRVTLCGFQLCVRNPLMNFYQFIIFDTPLPTKHKHRGWPEVKLHVDRESKTFKVLVVIDEERINTSLIYESATRCWDDCENIHGLNQAKSISLFVWKDVFHCLSETWGDAAEMMLESFVMTDGRWNWVEVEAEFPCVLDHSRTRFIASCRNNVVLVEASFMRKLYLRVWKLRNSERHDSQSVSVSQWEEVAIRTGSLIERFVGCHLTSVCCGIDDIIFTFTKRGFRRIVTYSFSDKSWAVTPCRENFDKLHPWEPSLTEDIFPGPDVDVHLSENIRRQLKID